MTHTYLFMYQSDSRELLSTLQVPHFSPWKGNLQISARTGEENQATFTSYRQKKTSLVGAKHETLFIHTYICTVHTYIQGSMVTVCPFVVQESYLRNTYIHTHIHDTYIHDTYVHDTYIHYIHTR